MLWSALSPISFLSPRMRLDRTGRRRILASVTCHRNGAPIRPNPVTFSPYLLLVCAFRFRSFSNATPNVRSLCLYYLYIARFEVQYVEWQDGNFIGVGETSRIHHALQRATEQLVRREFKMIVLVSKNVAFLWHIDNFHALIRQGHLQDSRPDGTMRGETLNIQIALQDVRAISFRRI